MPNWLPARFFVRLSDRSKRLPPTRRLRLESLVSRDLLSNVPLGATVNDTAEYMLGDVTVNVVLLESNGQVDGSSENWTAPQIADVKLRIEQGMQWWVETLENFSPNSYLNFNFDFTYADNPLSTSYEPISRPSDDYPLWVDEFLDEVGYLSNGSLSDDIRAFNHSQRVAHDSNWSFTIFVVNNAVDGDKQFATNGSFLRSFAFAGGQFFVMPADRPVSTIAHETGHMFWAADEYPGGDFYTLHRGYYDTQTLNAADGHPNPAARQPSIMASDALLNTAFANHTSAPSTLAVIGWQDSDGDGILDVLDVPFTLRGSGYFDEATRVYQFQGDVWVNALPNQNTEGTRNDMTINKIREIQYRIDGGAWTTLLTADDYKKALTVATPALAPGQHQIELRAIDTRTGVTSNIFGGTTERPTSTLESGIGGFVFRDLDGDGVWDDNEPALKNWEVTLLTSDGTQVGTPSRVEPDQFAESEILNSATSGVTLAAFGSGVANNQVLATTSASAATGTKAFANRITGSNQISTDWSEFTRQLRANFTSPTNQVRIDAFGVASGSIGRLEIYSASNELLGRYTTASLSGGARETMLLTRPTADIAYAIARSHAGTSIRLDNLRFGPDAFDKSDSQGAYTIDAALSGQFQLKITAPSGVTQTVPSGGVRTINPTAGQPLPNLDFGVNFATTWQNVLSPHDVDNNGAIATLDALAVLQDMSANGPRVLPTLAPNAPLPQKFFDVSGDGKLTARDVLLVIAKLSQIAGSAGPEPRSANPVATSLPPLERGVANQTATAPSGEASSRAQPQSSALDAPLLDAWASWYGQFDQSNASESTFGKPQNRARRRP
jgi:hypothetical protein